MSIFEIVEEYIDIFQMSSLIAVMMIIDILEIPHFCFHDYKSTHRRKENQINDSLENETSSKKDVNLLLDQGLMVLLLILSICEQN